MKLDELKETWKSQDTRTTVQTVLLLESIRKKQRRYNRFIWLRNIREGWLTILAAVYFARFLQGRWKTMRVIDSDESRAFSPLHEVVPAVDG